jgi:hypothetical protein
MAVLVPAGVVAITFFLAAQIALTLLYTFGRSQPYSDLLERCWRS